MKTKWLVAALTIMLALGPAQQTNASTGNALVDNELLVANASLPSDGNLYASEVPNSATAAAVIDVNSGRILYEKNANQRMLIASTTKIMTTLMAIESGVDLNKVVTVSSRAAGKEGSSVYLKAGEQYKLIDLLYAVMLRSGNDAATAVAEGVGGTEAKFVAMMNAKVKELGLTGTHFDNPTGLDGKTHYSTAHDMAVISAHALRNPIFAQIVSTQVKSIPQPGESWDRKMYNKNKMLKLYAGADGVKTGYTKAAGRCLVSSATRNGRQIAVVTLKASSDWVDHANLLDYGFQKYGEVPIAKENEIVQTVPVKDGVDSNVDVIVGKEFQYPVRQNEQDQLRKDVQIQKNLHAPLVAGQKVGEMRIYFQDKMVGLVPLLAAHDVAEKSFWEKFKQLFHGMISAFITIGPAERG